MPKPKRKIQDSEVCQQPGCRQALEALLPLGANSRLVHAGQKVTIKRLHLTALGSTWITAKEYIQESCGAIAPEQGMIVELN